MRPVTVTAEGGSDTLPAPASLIRNRCAQGASGAQRVDDLPSPSTDRAMTEEILLLDDDITTLTFVQAVLVGAGFKCSVCSDPEQALSIVASREEIAVVKDRVGL